MTSFREPSKISFRYLYNLKLLCLTDRYADWSKTKLNTMFVYKNMNIFTIVCDFTVKHMWRARGVAEMAGLVELTRQRGKRCDWLELGAAQLRVITCREPNLTFTPKA